MIIRSSSSELRTAFEGWLASNRCKTTLTKEPFVLPGAEGTESIELDDQLCAPVAATLPYPNGIDWSTASAAIDAAVNSSRIVIVVGAIVWPLVAMLWQI